MNGYKIVLLKAIFMLYKLPESERVCSGICSFTYFWSFYLQTGDLFGKAKFNDVYKALSDGILIIFL